MKALEVISLKFLNGCTSVRTYECAYVNGGVWLFIFKRITKNGDALFFYKNMYEYRIFSLFFIVFKQTRPKNLLLFVNPYSGKRNALIVYEKYAKPLFQVANVNVTCIISQKANQISDIIMEQNLDRYDGE